MNEMIKILLVDDHFFVRMGLASSLNGEEDLQVVSEAGSVGEALERYREVRPDVMLLDGQLPDGHGLDVLKKVIEEFPDAKVVMLSVDEAEECIYRAAEMGAMSYLSKSTERKELLKTIREAAQGRPYLPDHIKDILKTRSQREQLTSREMDVLKLVVRGEPNKLIAAALNIAESTVKVHLSRTFDKLGVQDRTSATTEALRRGLVSLD